VDGGKIAVEIAWLHSSFGPKLLSRCICEFPALDGQLLIKDTQQILSPKDILNREVHSNWKHITCLIDSKMYHSFSFSESFFISLLQVTADHRLGGFRRLMKPRPLIRRGSNTSVNLWIWQPKSPPQFTYRAKNDKRNYANYCESVERARGKRRMWAVLSRMEDLNVGG
jgi:hypothetical protein